MSAHLAIKILCSPVRRYLPYRVVRWLVQQIPEARDDAETIRRKQQMEDAYVEERRKAEDAFNKHRKSQAHLN